jgi:hypothetical protein
MALPASGAISLGAVNTELGLSSTAAISLGGTSVRTLYGISSGAIRLAADGYNKSNAVVPNGIASAATPILYNFTNTADSWTAAGNAILTNGATYLTISSNGVDPIIRRTVSFSGLRYPYIQINILRTAGATWDGKVFYSTSGHGESPLYYKQIPEPTWDGINYQFITLDMRTLDAGGTDWTANTITNVRLDLGATSLDSFRVDLIAFRGDIYPVAGLYQYTQAGYYNDDPAYFTAPIPQSAVNSIAVGSGVASTTSFQWVGYFLAPTTGNYVFSTATDDGSLLWIGDNAVSGYTAGNATVNNSGLHGIIVATGGNLTLTAGTYYPMRFQYGNNGLDGGVYLAFLGPGIANTNNGTGYYFYNADTTGI